jgi:hypothetical protein
MRLGLSLPHAGPSASPDTIARAASEAERIGLDAVWVLDRVLRPRAPRWGEPPALGLHAPLDRQLAPLEEVRERCRPRS